MPADATILLVDDEESIQQLLTFPLEREGYRVVQARDGEEAMRRFSETPIDLVVLDVMLPKLDGLEVCRRLRTTSAVPIIMLTARDDEVDKVLGLELGADDYITKPFSIREFRSRIRAMLRRATQLSERRAFGDEPISSDGLVIDPAKRTVTVDGGAVQLTYVEFEVLRTLATHPGRVYSRQSLLESVWGGSAYREPRTIDVHIRHLREKLESDPAEPSYILTVRGAGYRFRDAVAIGAVRSLRLRLILVLAAVVATAMGVVFLYVVPTLRDNLVSERLNRLERAAHSEQNKDSTLTREVAAGRFAASSRTVLRIGRLANAKVGIFRVTGEEVTATAVSALSGVAQRRSGRPPCGHERRWLCQWTRRRPAGGRIHAAARATAVRRGGADPAAG